MAHCNNNSNKHGNSKCKISNTTQTIDNNVFNGHVNDNFENVDVNDNDNYDMSNDLYSNHYVQLNAGVVPKFPSNGIKFGHINTRSLIGKFDVFKRMCGNLFDVICVNETWCDNSVFDSELHLPGYNLLRRDRNREGGGVALYINDVFNFKRRDDLCDSNVECIWAEITPPYMCTMLVCAVYNPNGKDTAFSNKLSSMLSTASDSDNEIILLGDFNCDFSCNVNAKVVNDLKFVCNMHSLSQLIDLPTRVTTDSSTIIDLFFTTKPELFTRHGVIQTSISDHFMIYGIRKSKPAKSNHRQIEYRSYKHFDETSFTNDLYAMPWEDIKSCDDVNDALNLWQKMFNDVIDYHLPKKSKRVKGKPTSPPWITNNITDAMSKRDFLHRKAIHSRSIHDWEAFKRCRNSVTKMIRKSKENFYKSSISDGTGDSKKLWKTLKDIVPTNPAKTPSSIIVDDTVLTHSHDIANGFNYHFTSVAKNLSTVNSNPGSANNDTNYNSIECDHFHIPNSNTRSVDLPCVSVNFICNEMSKMSSKKATGVDGLSCKLIKLALPAIADSITHIINLSLSTGIFPDRWKEAKVIPLHKAGDLSNTNNYRPISILPVLSKLIEKAVHKHLYAFINDNDIMSESQSGFRPRHSTETALTSMVNDWLQNMNSSRLTGVAFIDLRKAFDTVQHDILLNKLHALGATDTCVKWFKSYLSDRNQKVHFNGAISEALPLNIGVPQGSILGPLLFLIFINDLPKCISHGKLSMYADDSTLYVSDTDIDVITCKLKSDLIAVNDWLIKNKLYINADKTNIMLIGTGAKLRSVDDDSFLINIGDHDLNRVTHVKCLGVVIDDELNFHKQVGSVIQKVCFKIALFRRIKPFLDVYTLNILYKALIQPIFDYCGVTWYGRFLCDVDKLDKIHKRCARAMLGVNQLISSDFLFNMLGWEILSDRNMYFKSLMMYKTLNGLTPSYISDMFTAVSDVHTRNTRSATAGQLALPRSFNGPDTECFKFSFAFNGVNIWNDIDLNVRNAPNVQNFKTRYKHVYFKK